MTSYEVKQKILIKEINCEAVIMEHVKTKARVFLLPCEDDNKVFAIGFRTTPKDSTGVAHIIEHSVLCGSSKYPCKDPFIELAKGSLNTFLNAMTYPDKTVYPVASCNEKDFDNLISVYMDAVFNPNIYSQEKIFRQEGWHYELNSAESELSINGVVYNEMKGVYSTADGVLERAVGRILFPGHTYGEDSGGDPDVIPQLSYEEFLDFHRTYYHPSNSFIFLYGNCNMEEKLDFIDREYLSKYDYLEVDSAINVCDGSGVPSEVTVEYSIGDEEDEESTAILSEHIVAGDILNLEEYYAMQILNYVLLEVPGAPVREALINAGIGDDIDGGYMTEFRQPYFSVTARNASLSQKEEFISVLHGCLEDLYKNGLDRQSLMAALNMFEFRIREADYGSYPKGLIYGLQSFESWLYDADPTLNLRYEQVFAGLRDKLDKGYFEELLKDKLIDNSFRTCIWLKPVKGLTDARAAALKDKLAAYKAGLNSEEIDSIVRETAELKAYQSEPSDAESLKKIPLLKREDIEHDIAKLHIEERLLDGYKCLFSDVFTSGICYIRFLFNLDSLSDEDIQYAAFLTDVLGYIDTERHSYGELATMINLNLGDLDFSTECFPVRNTPVTLMTFSVTAKALYDKTAFAVGQIAEIVYESKLNDKKRLAVIIAEVKSRLKEQLQQSGNASALNRAGSHVSKDRWFSDVTQGIEYYRFISKLKADDELCDRLAYVLSEFAKPENMMIHITSDEEGYKAFLEGYIKNSFRGAYLKHKKTDVPARTNEVAEYNRIARADVRKEAFTTAGMVNYVARYGSYSDSDCKYSGVFTVLRSMLNYDYLWNRVRVLGGAYGCSSIFGWNRNVAMTSYRDPNLTATYDVYEGAAEYAGSYDGDERETTKAVIGAIAFLDTPLTPYNTGRKALASYMSNIDDFFRQKCRDEIIAATAADIRALKPALSAAMDNSYTCAIAAAGKVRECEDFWDVIAPLTE